MNDFRHALTVKGKLLKLKQEMGTATPNVTRVVAGSGYVEAELLEQQTEVSGYIAEMEVGLRELVDNKVVRLPVQLSNMGMNESVSIHQLGVYSEDPDDGEILYQIVQYAESIPMPSYMANRGGVILFSPEIDIWFDNAEVVSADITPGFLMTLRQFMKTQPTELVATISHSLGSAPVGALYVTSHAAGVQPAGEGPAGGGEVTQVPVRLGCPDSHTVEVYTIPKYAGEPDVHEIDPGKFSLVYPDSVTSLILSMR